MSKKIRATINYIRRCQDARAAGLCVSYTTDPAWLLDQAINRRAGWPDDPGFSRGSCRPLSDGRYPPKAGGDGPYTEARRLARRLNTPRLHVPSRDVPRRWRSRLSRGRISDIGGER